jgi:hypothetical protein
MSRVRIGIATLAVTAAIAPSAYAQSDDNRFAIGGNFGVRIPPANDARGSKDIGLLWRFGHSETGWGWTSGLNWFSTDVQQTVAGSRMELGELRVRPFMGGYGYTYAMGRTALEANLLGGYAFTSFRLAPSAPDVYRDRLGARALSADAGNTFVVKPEVGLWVDLSGKVGLNMSAGYMIARPKVTIRSSLGDTTPRFRADMFMLRIGAVYKLF